MVMKLKRSLLEQFETLDSRATHTSGESIRAAHQEARGGMHGHDQARTARHAQLHLIMNYISFSPGGVSTCSPGIAIITFPTTRASSPGVASASPETTGGSSSGVAIAIIIPPERHRTGSPRIFTTWDRCYTLHALPATGVNTASAMRPINLRRSRTQWLMLRCTCTPSKRDCMACCNYTCSLWNYKYTGSSKDADGKMNRPKRKLLVRMSICSFPTSTGDR